MAGGYHEPRAAKKKGRRRQEREAMRQVRLSMPSLLLLFHPFLLKSAF